MLCWLNRTELEAVVELPEGATLTQLDNTLRMFISFCAVYHGKSARGLVSRPCYLPCNAC